MKTRKVVIKSIGISLLFLLALVLIVIVFFVPKLTGGDKYDETNTVEYSATVNKIEKLNSDYIIYLNEYNCKLKVYSNQLDSEQDLAIIFSGDKISFRIISTSKTFNIFEHEEITQTVICSLYKEDVEIISLAKSNEILMTQMVLVRIFVVAVAVILVIVGILCSVLLFKKYKKKLNN